jgi:hypothetical protein
VLYQAEPLPDEIKSRRERRWKAMRTDLEIPRQIAIITFSVRLLALCK